MVIVIVWILYLFFVLLAMLIRLKVEKLLSDGHYKEVYRNTISLPDGISCPFEDILKVMMILYPKHQVSFTLIQ